MNLWGEDLGHEEKEDERDLYSSIYSVQVPRKLLIQGKH